MKKGIRSRKKFELPTCYLLEIRIQSARFYFHNWEMKRASKKRKKLKHVNFIKNWSLFKTSIMVLYYLLSAVILASIHFKESYTSWFNFYYSANKIKFVKTYKIFIIWYNFRFISLDISRMPLLKSTRSIFLSPAISTLFCKLFCRKYQKNSKNSSIKTNPWSFSGNLRTF